MSPSANGADKTKESEGLSTPGAGFKGSLPESGQLADLPLPRLLLDLYGAGFSGKLDLTRDKTTKRIVFQKGAPVVSESNLPSETLSHQLLDAGLLTEDDRSDITDHMKKRKCREGVAMLALEVIEPKQLFQALKEQVRRRVVEAFAWSKGSFRLHFEELATDEIQPFRNDPFLLVRDGLCTHRSPDQILADLMTQIERYPQPTKKLEAARKRMGGDPQIDSFFDTLDGRKTLGQAIGAGFNNTQLLATAWILVNAQLIDPRDTPLDEEMKDGSDAFHANIEIEIETGAANAEAAAKAQPGPDAAAASRKRSSKQSAAAGAMRKEVLERLEILDDLSHYELLGVPADAEKGAIRKAYFAAAKRYHPDALTSMGLNDIKDEANTVFSRIAGANEILSDAEKRRNYDAALGGGEAEIDVNALAQAETMYRKSEILVRMGDFRGALEFLRPCVSLWPDECVYQSALGWALYKQPQPELDAAREHLEQAVELDADDATAHLRLSVLLREMGYTAGSDELMARAKMLDPDVK